MQQSEASCTGHEIPGVKEKEKKKKEADAGASDNECGDWEH